MEYKDIDEKDNAHLMAFVQESRGLLNGAVNSQDYINTPPMWELFHKLRYAEEAMKFRNLPLDHEKLGDRFELSDFRAHVLVPGQKNGPENSDQESVDNP